MKKRKLIASRMRTPDGTLLESKHRHDMVKHVDAVSGETYMLDGGADYIRCSVNVVEATDESVWSDDDHETIRMAMRWGTRGRLGDQPLKWILLHEMDTDHIKRCLDTQALSHEYWTIMSRELQYRKANGL